jgi:hypothetical protein
MGFSSLSRKWGREKRKEAKAILIFAGSLNMDKLQKCAILRLI